MYYFLTHLVVISSKQLFKPNLKILFSPEDFNTFWIWLISLEYLKVLLCSMSFSCFSSPWALNFFQQCLENKYIFKKSNPPQINDNKDMNATRVFCCSMKMQSCILLAYRLILVLTFYLFMLWLLSEIVQL